MSKLSLKQHQSAELGPGRISGFRPPFAGPSQTLSEKPKAFKKTLENLAKYLRPFRFQLGLVLLFAILSTAFSIVGPKIMGQITTKLFEGLVSKYGAIFLKQPAPSLDFIYIARIILILIGLYLFSAFCSFVQQLIMASVSQKLVCNLRSALNLKLDRLPLKYFDSKTHGEIMSRITNDLDTVGTTLQQNLTQLITSLCTVIGILFMMLTISLLLTVITLITLPFSVLATSWIVKASQRQFIQQAKAVGEMNSHVEEMYSGHLIVKAFGYEKRSLAKFSKINAELYKTGWKAQFMSGTIMPIMNFISNLGYVLICVVGGIMTAKRTLKLGDIQAFIQYSRQFTMPLVQITNIVNLLQSTIASAERVFEVLEEEEEIPDKPIAKKLLKVRGQISFKNVKFRYKEEMPLIENFNLEVEAGQTIAIVGPTGAGKTTLVNLIMRFYEIQDGSIAIDGVDIRELERGQLREMIGMVLQDTWLFNGTIYENIAYGRKGASAEMVYLAAKAAHADHFIRALPEGYQTKLSEEASNLSQGERQLITIARAILAAPVILILDEATSNVDTRTEVYIQKALQRLMEGRTSFVIAHRLSTIRDAEKIIVMNNGKIIEIGNHRELLAQNGFYTDLYQSQFKGANLNGG